MISVIEHMGDNSTVKSFSPLEFDDAVDYFISRFKAIRKKHYRDACFNEKQVHKNINSFVSEYGFYNSTFPVGKKDIWYKIEIYV